MSEPVSPWLKPEDIQNSSVKSCLAFTISQQKRKAPDPTTTDNRAPRRSHRIRTGTRQRGFIYDTEDLPPELRAVFDDGAMDSESDDYKYQFSRKRRRADQTRAESGASRDSDSESGYINPEPIEDVRPKPAATLDCETAAQSSPWLTDASHKATEPARSQQFLTAMVNKIKADHNDSIEKLRITADNLIKFREHSTDIQIKSLRYELESAKAGLGKRQKEVEIVRDNLEKQEAATQSANDSLSRVRHHRNGLWQTNIAQEQKLKEATEKLKAIDTSYTAISLENGTLKTSLSTVKADLKNLVTAEVQAHANANCDLNKQVHSLGEKNAILENKCHSTDGEVKELREEKEKIGAVCDGLRAEAQGLREENKKLQAASNDLRTETQALQEETSRLRKRQKGVRELMRELMAD